MFTIQRNGKEYKECQNKECLELIGVEEVYCPHCHTYQRSVQDSVSESYYKHPEFAEEFRYEDKDVIIH